MRKLSRTLRWAMALVLMPVAPVMVLFTANKGKEFGEYIALHGMPSIVENPWVLAPVGGLFFGTLVALLFGAFTGKAANADR